MVLNDTILQGAIAGILTLAGVIYAAQKGLTTKREEVNAGASKSLDEAQQKLLDSALKELHDTQNDARATRKEFEEILKEERQRNLNLQERLTASFETTVALRQRLTEIEAMKDIIGAVSVEPKQIEEYKP